MQTVSELSLPELPVQQHEFESNPMPFVEVARKEHPWLAKFSMGYVIHGYQAAKDLLYMDDKMTPHFGSIVEFYGAEGTDWARFMEEILPSVEGEKHDRLRASVAPAFTPKSANQARQLMQRLIAELLDHWTPTGAFDFAEFAANFPISVMCGLLGMSTEKIDTLRDALETQVAAYSRSPGLLPKVLDAYNVLWNFADTAVLEREKQPSQDENALLDALIQSKNDGGLDERELRYLLIVLLLSGYDTSKNALTMMMYILLEYPDIYQRCAEDKSYCKKVVAEAIRHSTVVSPCRTLYEDLVYDGIKFPKGTFLCFALPLTGRDPAAFSQPMVFNPEREQAPRSFAFGRGKRFCLGQFIALAQLEEGIHLIAQRMARPELAGEITWRPFIGAWGLQTLPLSFSPVNVAAV